MGKAAKTPKPVDIADLRRRLGTADGPMSQADFGALCGVHQTTVARWESGLVTIKGPVAFMLRQLDDATPEPKQVA